MTAIHPVIRLLATSLMLTLALSMPARTQSAASPSAPITTQELLDKWREAITTVKGAPAREVKLLTNSNEEGVDAKVEECISSDNRYRIAKRREFDTTEENLVDTVLYRLDWNGFLRQVHGKELMRFRAAAFELQMSVFGPPASLPESTTVRASGDSAYELTFSAPGGGIVSWIIDAKTYLPLRSSRAGDETAVTTVYSNWRDQEGTLMPYRGLVTETDKPDYSWERTSIESRRDIASGDFQNRVAGPSDTHMDANIPPIPFNFENGHIIFAANLNGKDSVLFIFDTGADVEAINEPRLAEYHLQPYGSTTTTGGGGTAAYSYARGATFKLPGVEIRNQHVSIVDESGLERALGMKFGGLLGYDFISRFVVEIDYQKQLITLHDPKTWNYTGNGFIVPLIFDDGIPFTPGVISVPTKPAIPAYFVVDFGAFETMTLTSPFVKANDLVNLAGTNASVLKTAGLEGQFFTQNNVRGRLDSVSIGPLVVRSVPVSFSVNTKGAYASTNFSGTIGQSIDKRYHVFLDYARDRVIFEPTAETNKPFPDRTSYGLTLLASGEDLHTYTVTAVRPQSPADVDAFKKGDIVVGLDGKSKDGFTLGELRDCLSHEGAHHTLQVFRDGKTLAMSIEIKLISLEKR